MQGREHHLHLLMIGTARDTADRLVSHLRGAGLSPHAARLTTPGELKLELAQSWDLVLYHVTYDLPLQQVVEQCAHLPLIMVGEAPESGVATQRLRAQLAENVDFPQLSRTLLREAEIALLQRQIHQLEHQQAALQRRHDLLLQQSPGAYCYLQDGMHLYCNQSYARLFGYDDVDSVRTRPLLDLVQVSERNALRAVFSGDAHADTLELQGRRRDGSSMSLHFRFTPVDYHGVPCMLLAVGEASANSLLTDDTHRERDLLTGLDTLSRFERTLESVIHAAAQSGELKTLILVQLQDFAELAAVLGKAALRTLLRDLSNLLLQHSQLVARTQDHEFALILDEADAAAALAFCRSLQRELELRLSDALPAALELGADIGMALIDGHSHSVSELLKRARRQGLQHPSSGAPMDAALIAAVRQAVQQGEVQMLFLPLVPLRADLANGYELTPVFPELTHHDTARIHQAAVLGGLSHELDQQLTQMALKVAVGIGAETPLWLPLNASTWQHAAYLPWLSAELGAASADMALQVELSEVDLHRQREAALAFCKGLLQLGLGFGICQFGGGLDSSGWLRELLTTQDLRPSLLKLDPALLRTLGEDEAGVAQVRRLIEDAHSLRIPVAAPEITDLNLLPLLWQLGVDYVQGSALGASLPEWLGAMVPAPETIITAKGDPAAAQESTWH